MLVRIRTKKTLVRYWWACKLVQPLWKAMWNFLKELKIDISGDPAILHLGIYTKEMKAGCLKDICTPLFISVFSQ